MTFAAILSASRASGDSPAALRATLHFAGQTLVEYQARQAVRAGADRIMILVSADGIAVALIRDMVSMVRDAPRDADVLLVADGAVVAQGHYDALAGQAGNALLVTDDSRASAPFERIDAGQRWAGLARINPALLFGTLDMIGDWDLALTLVRSAVQGGAVRITVPQDDLLEGRVALVDGQEQADLAAQAVMSTGTRSGSSSRGGIEHYLFGPLARLLGPALMRSQVPAMQVRIGSIALAGIALMPLELGWPGTGLRLLLLAGSGMVPNYLALLLGIITLADRWRRTGAARAWMIFTPGTALLVLLLALLTGAEALGFDVAMLAAIGSIGAIILSRRGG